QKVLNGGSTKGTVVRSAEDNAELRDIPGEAEARAPGGVGDANAVVVKANSSAQVEVPEVSIVLKEEGLLTVVGRLVEREAGRSRRRQTIGAGNLVRKLFVDKAVDGISSGFDFVVIKISGDRGADVAFAKTAILKRLNGRGKEIGSEVGFVVAYATLHGADDAGGESMLIRDLA